MEELAHDRGGAFLIDWLEGETVVTVVEDETVRALLRVLRRDTHWVVLSVGPSGDLLFALHAAEVRGLLRALEAAEQFGDVRNVLLLALRDVLQLEQRASSTPLALPRPERADPVGERGVASGRVVLLDEEGKCLTVGVLQRGGSGVDPDGARDLLRYAYRFEEGEEADTEYVEYLKAGASPDAPASRDNEDDFLGPVLGGGPKRRGGVRRKPVGLEGAPPPSAPHAPAERGGDAGTMVPVTISGSAPGEAAVGDIMDVQYRIERSGPDAQPLDERFEADVKPDQPIRIMVVTKGDSLELAGNRVQEVDPPIAGEPVEGTFSLVVVQQGRPAELSVMFFQGGSHLGSLGFSVRIVEHSPNPALVRNSGTAAPRREADDEVLIWTIVENRDGDGLRRYEHHLVGVQVGQFRDFSKSIQDSGSGYAAMRTQYLERTYERVLHPVRSAADLPTLAVKVRTAGTSLCRMLLDPDVTRRLWEWRDRIKTIRVHSYDPLIPWELVRLQHPDTGELDDCYLAEYGLVRWLPDLPPAPAQLRLDRWRYLAADYPNGSAISVGGEVAYFTEDLPRAGTQPEPIEPTLTGVIEALERDDFDVLHLACHGEANLHKVESARLLIGDREGADGTVEWEVVEASDVVASARFRQRPGPITFLTACEGGRAAPSLTDWEGWPHAFLKGGASAFVGTSWSVRSKPAYAFSRAFYDALLGGETLAEASTAGRQAAKQLGDASWLAYKVYGNPLARRV